MAGPRSQPYRLQWPLTPEQVESLDEMLQLLFDDLGNESVFPEKEDDTVLKVENDTIVWDKVDLEADVEGTLPIANGGTAGTATPTAGAVAYGTGSAYAFSAAGTAGQALLSGGTGSPTWGSAGQTQAQILTRVMLRG